MLTCKEASYLASKKLDEKLTWRESLSLRIHLTICRLCRRYAIEIKKLHKVMQKAGQSSMSILPKSVKLSSQSRERIQQALDKIFHQTDVR